MDRKKRRDLSVIAGGLGIVAAGYLGWNTDAVARRMLVGEWHCDPYFSVSPHDLTFVRDGYAEFDSAGKAVEHGIWDVWKGRLIEIDSGGGSTSATLRVSFPGNEFELLSSKGDVGAVCRQR